MSKFDEAIDILNRIGKNGEHHYVLHHTYRDKLLEALERGNKLEKLLELYRRYFYVTERWYETTNSGNVKKELVIEIEKVESEIKK